MKILKKFICIATATLMLATSVSVNVKAEEIMLGDVVRNGKVDLQDALETLKLALGITPLTEEKKAVVDVNKDGNVNLTDAFLVLKKSLGIINDFDENTGNETDGNENTQNGNTENNNAEHIHSYVWTHESFGDYKVNKCSCGDETGERAYNLGDGVYGQWKDNMAAELMYWTNIQREGTWTNPIDAGGNYLGVRNSPPLNNTLSDKAKTRALQCVNNYSHDGMLTTGECLARGCDDAGSVSSAWMASSDHGPEMCDYRYTQGGTACIYYDTDGNGTMSYIWVLVLDGDSWMEDWE